MRILLISPPLYYPCGPYLAVPSLKAFLEQNGHAVVQKDINVEFFDRVLSSSYLTDCYRIISSRYKELNEKKLLNKNKKTSQYVLKEAISLAPYIIKNVDAASQFFKVSRSGRFFLSSIVLNLKRLWNLMILRSGFKIVEAAYYPTVVNFNSLKMRYSITSSSDILKAVEDRNENLFIDFFERYVLPDIVANKPGLVGISINDAYQIIPGLTLAKLIKELGFYVVIGGAIFTKELKIKGEFADLCDGFVIDEGEHALLELIKQLENKRNFHNVPNLAWFSNQDKELIINELSHIEDLDQLPAPDFKGLPVDRYFKFYKKGISFPIAVSKGCYWNKCAFCAITARKKYRTRKIPLVINDLLEAIDNYNIRSFIFTGESLPPGYLEDLSEAIIERKLHIKWMGYARFEEGFSESLCQLLAKAGCEKLLIGLESGSQRILDLMHKGIYLANIIKVLSNLRKAGIATHLFVLVGFPTETPKEAGETLKFLLDNRNKLDCPDFTFRIEIVYYHVASDLFRFPGKYGIGKTEIKNIDDDLDSWDKYNFSSPDGISYVEAQKLVANWHNLIQKEYYYYGLQQIILNEEIRNNFNFRFTILLMKLIRHSASSKVNNLFQDGIGKRLRLNN